MITLISISLIVFHPHAFPCVFVHTADAVLVKVPLIALLLWSEVGVYLRLSSLMFSLISTSRIPHYALLNVSCKQRQHLMWRECDPCWSSRTAGHVFKPFTTVRKVCFLKPFSASVLLHWSERELLRDLSLVPVGTFTHTYKLIFLHAKGFLCYCYNFVQLSKVL